MRSLREAFADQLERDRRVRAHAERRLALRQKINQLATDVARLQAERTAEEAFRAARNRNGRDHHEGERTVEQPTPRVDAGGTRRPEGWFQGQPFYRDEDEG